MYRLYYYFLLFSGVLGGFACGVGFGGFTWVLWVFYVDDFACLVVRTGVGLGFEDLGLGFGVWIFVCFWVWVLLISLFSRLFDDG